MGAKMLKIPFIKSMAIGKNKETKRSRKSEGLINPIEEGRSKREVCMDQK